jgi:hypothetical protein
MWDRDIKDPDIIREFNKKIESFVDERDPVEVILTISENHGWNQEDIILLASLKDEEYYKIFKNTKGNNLQKVIRVLLKFKDFQDADKNMIKISEKSEEALRKIAKESEINKKRVSMYGIK